MSLYGKVERETLSEKRGSRKEKAAAEREKEKENACPIPSLEVLLEDRKVSELKCCIVLFVLCCVV